MDITTILPSLAAACPGSVITIIQVSVPASTSRDPAAPSGEVIPSTDSQPPPPRTDTDLIADLADQGIEAVKLSDLAAMLTLGEAELRRAVKAEVLPELKKADGQDAGAWMATPERMLYYLKVREAVTAGRMESPPWWNDVVKAGGRQPATSESTS